MSSKLPVVKRRESILKLIEKADHPLPGAAIAKKFGVSRQIIVSDIAMLRVQNNDIISTSKGYMLLKRADSGVSRRFTVKHTVEQLRDELNLIVDYGGKVLDVIVDHPYYGELRGELNISNRADVEKFLESLEKDQGTPLLEMSGGLHTHTISASSEEQLDVIEEELRRAGLLVESDNKLT